MTSTTTYPSKAANGVFALIAGLATLAVVPWMNKSMWRDEASSLYSAHLSWTGLWQQSRFVDRVLLLYYALLHVWLQVSNDIVWARSLSLVAFALTVYLVMRLGYGLGGLWCAVSAGILTATNPLMIRAALEARPYALATLSATIAVASLLRWVREGESRWMWVFSIAYVTTLLLQMFMVAGPLSVMAAIVVLKRRDLRRHWRSISLPLGVVVLATFSFLIAVVGQRGQVAWIPSIGAKMLVVDLEGPASGLTSSGQRYTYAAVILLLVGTTTVLCVQGWRKGAFHTDRHRVDKVLILLAWATLPTLVLIGISFAKSIYVDRYVTASVPGMALTVGMLIVGAHADAHVRHTSRARTVMNASAAGIAACTLIFNSVVVDRTEIENLQDAARYVSLRVGPLVKWRCPIIR